MDNKMSCLMIDRNPGGQLVREQKPGWGSQEGFYHYESVSPKQKGRGGSWYPWGEWDALQISFLFCFFFSFPCLFVRPVLLPLPLLPW